MNSYSLSRAWFDWCFENPEKITPNHTALYFFIIEHCNRLGWKEKFSLPTTMAKEAIGIRSYNTYIKTLNDLIDFGFIILIEKSKNQYSSNIIALSNFNKAHNKALNKALIKHVTKQVESTQQSTDSIYKQYNNKQVNNIKDEEENFTNDNKENYLPVISKNNENQSNCGDTSNISEYDTPDRLNKAYLMTRQRLSNDVWIFGLSTQFKLTQAEILKLINTFSKELVLKYDHTKSDKQLRQHFVNYLKKQMNGTN